MRARHQRSRPLFLPGYFLFSPCNRNFPGLNLTLMRGGIMLGVPVRGLRPSRSVCCQQVKVPNPWSMTLSPRARLSVITSCHVLIICRHSVCVQPSREDNSLTISVLFILYFLLVMTGRLFLDTTHRETTGTIAVRARIQLI